MAVGGASPEWVAIPELGVAPLTDPETDLEDELPTPDDSPSGSASGPEGVCLPGVRPALPDAFDLELEKALLDVPILPVMVTPLVDPVVGLPEAPSSYPAPPRPELPDDNPDPIAIFFTQGGHLPDHAVWRMMFTDHRPVRPRWTSTCREMVICCWGSRRTCPFW